MKNLIVVLFFFCVLVANAQIPSLLTLKTLESIQEELDHKLPSRDGIEFFTLSWIQDSVISTRDEISLYKTGFLFQDLEQENPSMYQELSAFKDDKISVRRRFGQNSSKAREHYEKERLKILKNSFTLAHDAKDKKLMMQVLDMMSFYYQNPSLLSQYNLYEKEFVEMRKLFSLYVYTCYHKGECEKQEINYLFALTTKIYPDLGLAKAVLDYIYIGESAYLISGQRPGDVKIALVTEYFLSLLLIFNIAEQTNQVLMSETAKIDTIVMGFRKLIALNPRSSPSYRDFEGGLSNLTVYLFKRYNVSL